MGWKTWPYWLKGGIIAVLIYLLISIISLIEFQINYGKSDMGTLGYWIIMLFGIFLFMFYEKLFLFINYLFYQEPYPNKTELLPLIVFILLNAIIYFLIGSIIGFLINKIKSKKKKLQASKH